MNKNKLMYYQKNPTEIIFSCVLNTLALIFIYFCSIVLFFYLTHSYYPVQGTSMQPTIMDEQAVFVNMFENYTHEDIVIGYNPSGLRIIKRVVGLSGDKITFVLNNQGFYDTLIIYNNTTDIVVLQEDYVVNKIPSGQWSDNYVIYSSYYDFFVNKYSNLKTFEEYEYNNETIKFLVIPEDSVFLLGDNRTASIDCATYGAISSSSVTGKVTMVVDKDSFYFGDILLFSFGLRSMI